MPSSLDELFPTKPFDAKMKVERVPWAVRDLWQKGKINVMFGAEKAGKSRLLNWILTGSLLAPAVLDLAIDYKPQRMLYLAGEELVEEVNGRMLRYSAHFGVQPRNTYLPIDF